MNIMRTTTGINKTEAAGAAHVQIRFSDALRRVLPTRLTSYLEFRGRICQETSCDRSSVTFDLRQCACLIWPNMLVVEGDLDVVGVLAW